jgi:hypothetical protein
MSQHLYQARPHATTARTRLGWKSALAAATLTAASLAGPGAVATAASAHAAKAHHACTKTSTHHCIQGGEFCPQAKYGKSGWNASGKRYVCKGNHTHPHWMLP